MSNSISITGYSERGMVNSFLYEMRYNAGLALFLDFLKNIINKKTLEGISAIEIVVEHSLSDFGDGDVILLLKKQADIEIAVFIEAKVQNCNIEKEISEFEKHCVDCKYDSGKGFTSNLFTQLAHKYALMAAIEDNTDLDNLEVEKNIFKAGKKNRKLGKNLVVINFVKEKLSKAKKKMYVGIVPNKKGIEDGIGRIHAAGRDKWKMLEWQFITWEEIKRFCEDKQCFPETLDTFAHNEPLIYKQDV